MSTAWCVGATRPHPCTTPWLWCMDRQGDLAGIGWRAAAVPARSLGYVPVPFNANAACRHHIPGQRHRVTNPAAYDAALRQRGSLAVWFTDAAISAWKAKPRTTRGGQPRCWSWPLPRRRRCGPAAAVRAPAPTGRPVLGAHRRRGSLALRRHLAVGRAPTPRATKGWRMMPRSGPRLCRRCQKVRPPAGGNPSNPHSSGAADSAAAGARTRGINAAAARPIRMQCPRAPEWQVMQEDPSHEITRPAICGRLRGP